MKVKYKRSFECDNSIAWGIKWLNKNGFYTLGCCSGLSRDHDNGSLRDKLYIDFEWENSDKVNEIKLVAHELGFKIRDFKNKVRVETEDINKYQKFRTFIDKLKSKKYKLNVRTMGISNFCKDPEENIYSIQFYDFDYNGETNITPEEQEKILEIFPYDCILYKTKHGLQFIGFALLRGLFTTKARAIQTSKELGKQDYWTVGKDLTLRVAPKWKLDTREVISNKPKFLGVLKKPNQYIVSGKHLDFYKKYMGLPEWVYNRYLDCDRRDYSIKIYHYKTRD